MVIIEAFSKNNLPFVIENPKVGGPRDAEMLCSKEEILQDFADFEIIQLEEVITELNEGEFHLVAHIWIKNNEGKYLVQKRNKQSDRVFGQYAATGGAVTTGENSLLGAQRETFEEMGIMIDLDKFKLVKRYYIKDPKASFITDLYLVKENILLSELNLEYNEVSACKYMSMDEIKELVKDDMFWDYENTYIRKGYFDLIEKS